MGKIKGIDVILYAEKQIGTDGFNKPVYKETAVTVSNVLVSPASSQEVIDSLQLEGKKAEYTLAIPKGDTNNWKDKKVSFLGETYKTFGMPIKGIDELVPGMWNTKVMVERYE